MGWEKNILMLQLLNFRSWRVSLLCPCFPYKAQGLGNKLSIKKKKAQSLKGCQVTDLLSPTCPRKEVSKEHWAYHLLSLIKIHLC